VAHDTTVIRLVDGTRGYLHAVIDNFSRRILAWRVADTFAPVNSVAVLVEASRGATPSATTPAVLADTGVENVNARVDDLITAGALRRVWAFTELKFSNSMNRSVVALPEINGSSSTRWTASRPSVDWSRSTSPNTIACFRIRRFADRRDEMSFGTGDAVPADLTSRAAAARRTCIEANRTASCERCPSVDAAA
jgi:putative transposase